MRFVMHPEAASDYPIWWVGLAIALLGIALAVAVELIVRNVVSVEFRRQHNDVAAAMLSIVGVTYAVLLAFVVMLAWEGFNRAKAASYAEAGIVREIIDTASGFPEPMRSVVANDIMNYARIVIAVEWPAQAAGRRSDRAQAPLDALNRSVAEFRPASVAEVNLQSQLLQLLARLQHARQERMMAAGSGIPGIVWVVLLLGGALTIAFASFLGTPSLTMHLAMSSALAVSGALALILIVALGNPFRGDFRVSAAPFTHVLMDAPGPLDGAAGPAVAGWRFGRTSCPAQYCKPPFGLEESRPAVKAVRICLHAAEDGTLAGPAPPGVPRGH